jgi:predicted acylesterase/phospholipase RssA
MNNSDNTVPVHLVLGGGGVRCLSYAGALRFLVEHGISFASVSACSAGTFIGALLCAGLSSERIEREIDRISLRALAGTRAYPSVFSLLAFLHWPFALFGRAGFPQVFREILGCDPTFGELETSFATAGIDIISDRLLVYTSETHPTMRVSEAMDIAVSFPLVYPAYEPKGRIVLDCSIASECPVWLATSRDDSLPILALRPSNPPMTAHPNSATAYLFKAMSSAARSRDSYVIEQMPRVRLFEIDCADVRSDQFDLPPERLRYLIAAGRAAAEKGLSRYGNDLSSVREVKSSARGASQDDIAEDWGRQIMTNYHQRLSKEVRNQVFISYAHADRDWLDRVQLHLKPYRNISVLVWDDTRIRPGQHWQDEIEQALTACKVAVLLVTPEFVASDFITKSELPRILAAERRGALKLHWLAIVPCAWDTLSLSSIQAANNPNRPLASLPDVEQHQILVEFARKVKEDI